MLYRAIVGLVETFQDHFSDREYLDRSPSYSKKPPRLDCHFRVVTIGLLTWAEAYRSPLWSLNGVR